MNYSIPPLPLKIDVETRVVLKKSAVAHRALAELKGITATIPNENILINTLSLQEAKDSSAIENIITTHDEIYRSDVLNQQFASIAAKEIYSYSTALKHGFEEVKKTGLLTNNTILKIQSIIEENNAGFRKLPGTSLKNDVTGQVIYTPPQSSQEVIDLMNNLERFINDDSLSDFDPLTKMAIIHHQFESIHPFYDGNGRTGRIINILYLVKQDLLKIPVLYLSRFINQKKVDYYSLLQSVRTDNVWEDWILFVLEGVEKTSLETIELIKNIKVLMQKSKHRMRKELPNIYSQDILNNLFRHPYTKIEFVVNELGIHRNTASKYLEELVGIGLLSKYKLGKENFYLNNALFELLRNVGQIEESD
ncbi:MULTISPECIES: Fic family protein [Spirulina sp. CCY15215]|uniref:Fic family protein n=1 Tax=Spirulina sp. CCY15215 TaxID=2767591 RepID=UPI00194E16B4|nr:Fic family protein [Spirulina major]